MTHYNTFLLWGEGKKLKCGQIQRKQNVVEFKKLTGHPFLLKWWVKKNPQIMFIGTFPQPIQTIDVANKQSQFSNID